MRTGSSLTLNFMNYTYFSQSRYSQCFKNCVYSVKYIFYNILQFTLCFNKPTPLIWLLKFEQMSPLVLNFTIFTFICQWCQTMKEMFQSQNHLQLSIYCLMIFWVRLKIFSKMKLMIYSYDRWSVVEIVSPVRLRWPKNTHLEWDLRRKRSDCEPSSDVGDNALLVWRGE